MVQEQYYVLGDSCEFLLYIVYVYARVLGPALSQSGNSGLRIFRSCLLNQHSETQVRLTIYSSMI